MPKKIFAIVFALLLCVSPFFSMVTRAAAADAPTGSVYLDIYAVSEDGTEKYMGYVDGANYVSVFVADSYVDVVSDNCYCAETWAYPFGGTISGLAYSPTGEVVFAPGDDIVFTESTVLYMLPAPDPVEDVVLPFLGDFTSVFIASLPLVNSFYFSHGSLTIAGAVVAVIAAVIAIAMIARWLFRMFGKRK